MSFTIGDPERNRTSNWGLGIPRYIRLTTGPLGLSIAAFYFIFKTNKKAAFDGRPFVLIMMADALCLHR